MSGRNVLVAPRGPVGNAEPPHEGRGADEPEVLRLRVSAPTVEDALRLIDALPEVHAELAPFGTSYAVLVEVHPTASPSPQLARTLARIDRWLAATDVPTARVEPACRGAAVETPPPRAEV